MKLKLPNIRMDGQLCNHQITSTTNMNRALKELSDWARFAEWVHCMCVITFDLELGQAIEIIYPDTIILSEQEKMNICYLAFPDSNSGCMGDTQFHVRLRITSKTNKGCEQNILSPEHTRFNTECMTGLKVDTAHYWGFVYFRQRKEPSIPRGYFQKSFIILTKLPFFGLFYEVLSQVAQSYFNNGFNAIKSACLNICTWPSLNVGKSLNLKVLDTIYEVTIPKANSKIYSNSNTTIRMGTSCIENPSVNCWDNVNNTSRVHKRKVIASVNEIDIFQSLSCLIPHIFTLWELVLTAEPIVIMGSSPASTSNMVQSLISLISPLEYCAESRPYFTIHDSEFKEFTREYAQFRYPPSIIVGVTNPYFIKLFKDWPHMVRISVNEAQVNQLHGFNLTSHYAPTSSHNISCLHTVNAGTIANKITHVDSSTTLITKYKPFLKKDKTFIRKILIGVDTKRPEHVQSILLRRNLLELTQSFMIPLERYIASLMPLQKDISPFKSAPNPSRFKEEEFLATLEQSGPHLTSPLKGNWKGLYKKFFMSPNFRGWYDSRHQDLQNTLQTLQLQALSGVDLTQWAQGKQEVEIVDMFIKLKQKLNMFSNDESKEREYIKDEKIANTSVRNQFTETRSQLLQQIENLKQALPDDLKTILFNV